MKLTLAGAVSFSTVLAAGAPTFAAEDGGKLNSKAFIKFEKNTEIVNPVSPLDPSVEVETKDPKDPNDPHEPGTQGPLSIDYVSNFQFEKHKASGNNEIYYASLDSVTKRYN